MKVCENCRYYARFEKPYRVEASDVLGECFLLIQRTEQATFHIFSEKTGCNHWRAKE